MNRNLLPWRDRAKCRDTDPYPFEVPNQLPNEAQAEAKRLCGGCPVITECRTDALQHPVNDQWGIVGGLTAQQRKDRIIRARHAARMKARWDA